ncbi:MAG: HD domain-containing protein [Candidatus Woesearchaeota archaeon]
MREEFVKAIEQAKTYIHKIEDVSHNIVHVKSVVDYAIIIAESYPEVDLNLIEVAAWWHDVGRVSGNQGHEQRSAEIARDFLKQLGVELEICNQVYDAIVFHKWSMKPVTLEGEIIRDADKLDFISISRWKACLDANILGPLKELSLLLPRLRNELLHLDISKKVYDSKIIEFKNFIKTVETINFSDIKKQILSYDL